MCMGGREGRCAHKRVDSVLVVVYEGVDYGRCRRMDVGVVKGLTEVGVLTPSML